MSTEKDIVHCPKCKAPAELVQVGSASGRGHYRCSDRDCNNQWREKNQAAVSLGRLGGMARSASLSKERKEELATAAAEARWRRVKLARNA